MRFQLSAKGTISECREALNNAIAALEGPHKQEHAVVRSAAHYVVEENLDPLYTPWVVECNENAELRTKGSARKDSPEPTTEFSIDISINVREVARQEVAQ